MSLIYHERGHFHREHVSNYIAMETTLLTAVRRTAQQISGQRTLSVCIHNIILLLYSFKDLDHATYHVERHASIIYSECPFLRSHD